MEIANKDIELIDYYQNDEDGWNRFAKEVLGVRLDWEQRKILKAIQHNKRVSVRSGNGRGKDYVAAVASLCFLYLNYPSKVINTAPTQRQVINIMFAEMAQIYKNARINLGGELLTNKIQFDDKDWYMLGFKAQDKAIEDWSGFHSPNLMVVITEASGVEDETFQAIEGVLTGNSKLVIIFNPNRTSGEAYQSTKSPEYVKFKLNSLRAPNVRAKKVLIPGQVDYAWVDEKIQGLGWVNEISEDETDKTMYDFKWNGRWYRPNDLFLVKVMGEFPRESEDVLFPISWIEAANERWKKCNGKGQGELKIGVDVAGMGRDDTIFVYRRGNVIEKIEVFSRSLKSETIHMQIAGKIKNELKEPGSMAYVDAIGEGAGVFSRLKELGVKNVISVKFSDSASRLTDITGGRTFANMKAYLYWALRDALDPKFEFNLAIPPNDRLLQEFSGIHWEIKSNGDIIIGSKKELEKSPDIIDALANTFYPERKKINVKIW